MKFTSISIAAVAGIQTATSQIQVSSHRRQQRNHDGKRALADDSVVSTSMSVGFMEATTAAISSGESSASKSGKSRKCTQDDFLVERFGKQICPSQVESKYNKVDNATIQTYGLSGDTISIVDTFSTYIPYPRGYLIQSSPTLALSREQAESVCITKCENNANCVAVSIESIVPPVDKSRVPPEFIKMEHTCTMVNPELGPGAFLAPVTQLSVEVGTFVVFLKNTGPELPPVQVCDIDEFQLSRAFNCQISFDYGEFGYPGVPEYNATLCDPLLTDDFKTYLTPAYECLTGGVATGLSDFVACFNCISDSEYGSTQQALETTFVCPIASDDDTTVLRGECKEQCSSSVCETEVQTTLLCLQGSPLILADGTESHPSDRGIGQFGGNANAPDYTCPVFGFGDQVLV